MIHRCLAACGTADVHPCDVKTSPSSVYGESIRGRFRAFLQRLMVAVSCFHFDPRNKTKPDLLIATVCLCVSDPAESVVNVGGIVDGDPTATTKCVQCSK